MALTSLPARLPTVVPPNFLRTIRIMKGDKQAKELKVFYNFLYILLGIAGFIMISLIIQNKRRFIRTWYIASALVVRSYIALASYYYRRLSK